MASTIYNKNNMSTAEVKKMQQALIDKGYDLGSTGADGIWGEKTSAALSKYKADTGGSNTYGTTVGNETFNKLYGTTTNKNTGSGTTNKNTGSSAVDYSTVGGAIGTGATTLPGFENQMFQANLVTPEMNAYANSIYNQYTNSLDTLNSGYDKYISTLEGGANKANAALEEARTNALAGIKTTYDDSARNYYRLYRTQENELPEQLSSIGATGGASESAALRLMNNYSDNLYKNESARNNDINYLNENYYNAVAQNSQKLASDMANAYLQLSQQQLALEENLYAGQNSIYDAYTNAYNQQQASEAAASVDKWNTSVKERMQEQLDKGDTIWTWTDDDGKIHWTTYESKGVINGGTKLSTSASESKKKSSVGDSTTTGNPIVDEPVANYNLTKATSAEPTPTTSSSYAYYKRVAQSHLNDARNSDGLIGGQEAALDYIGRTQLSSAEKIKLAKELGLG